jgi:serine protease inhibitor
MKIGNIGALIRSGFMRIIFLSLLILFLGCSSGKKESSLTSSSSSSSGNGGPKREKVEKTKKPAKSVRKKMKTVKVAPKVVEKPIKKLTKVEMKQYVTGVNGVAYKLYKELAKQKGNIHFSPLSVTMGLSMAISGTNNESETKALKTLGIASKDIMVRGAASQLSGTDTGVSTSFVLANRLYCSHKNPFLPSYRAGLKRYFKAGALSRDFTKSVILSKEANDWVSLVTKKQIPSIVSPGDFSGDTRMLLLSTIYFSAPWRFQFLKHKTSLETFYLSRNRRKKMDVNMMYLFAPFKSLRKGAVKVAVMDYDKGDFSMVLFTNGGKMKALEKIITTPGRVEKLLKKCIKENVKIFLPRFSVTSQFDLTDSLKKLGFGHLFKEGVDFSKLSKGDLLLSKVRHNAMIRIDEKGVISAATTAIIALLNGDPNYPKIRFNTPFMYMIKDNRSGAILFMGRVMNPTPAEKNLSRGMFH